MRRWIAGGPHRAGGARQRGQRDTDYAVHQGIDINLTHEFVFRLHHFQQLQHLSLGLDVIGVTSARGLLRSRTQIGDAAAIEWEAVTLPLDHPLGFELADAGPAAIEMQRQCRRADGRVLADPRRDTGLATEERSLLTVSAIVFVPVALR